jgi:membrane fusion protein (multidrug efflux system)
MKQFVFIFSLLAGLALVLFLVFGTKISQFRAMGAAGEGMKPPPESVATFTVEEQTWKRSIDAVGSIEPTQGVLLEAETAGLVESINFENGQTVEAGSVLVQLNIKVEQAELKAAEAVARLAEVELERAQRLRKGGNVPQSDLDRAIAQEEKTKADVENIKARIARKTIKAPFTGQVGIRRINLGQYLAQGAPIVALQANQRVYVNFTLPQQALGEIESGLPLTLISDAYPEVTFEGKVTAISPEIDPKTRSVQVQGTLENPDGLLRAGLFVRVKVALPQQDRVMAVPATSVLYAPYGNSVYKVEAGEEGLIAKQHFIRIGTRRGDFVSIENGVEVGDDVVSAGAFKLRNGINVNVNNELAPKPELAPTPDNS